MPRPDGRRAGYGADQGVPRDPGRGVGPMPLPSPRPLLVLLAAIAALVATPALADPPKLLVFAAASLKNALDDVNAAYAKQSGVAPSASYAASSVLARQIEQ